VFETNEQGISWRENIMKHHPLQKFIFGKLDSNQKELKQLKELDKLI
jgi:hypothetical protein